MKDETTAADLVITDREGKHRLHGRDQPVLRLPDGRFAMEVDGRVRPVALITLNVGPAMRGPSFAHLDERLWADARPPGDSAMRLPPEALAGASRDEVDDEFKENSESFPLSVDILEAWWGEEDKDDLANLPPPRVIRHGQES